MGEEEGSRNALIGRVGTFFIVVGLFAIIIFISSDVSRADKGRAAGVTQTYIIEAVQAIQTRDTGATQVAPHHQPTPTLTTPEVQLSGASVETPLFFSTFCLGLIGLGVGWTLWRVSAPPRKPGTRFEGVRKVQQRRREARERREAAKKEKEKKK